MKASAAFLLLIMSLVLAPTVLASYSENCDVCGWDKENLTNLSQTEKTVGITQILIRNDQLFVYTNSVADEAGWQLKTYAPCVERVATVQFGQDLGRAMAKSGSAADKGGWFSLDKVALLKDGKLAEDKLVERGWNYERVVLYRDSNGTWQEKTPDPRLWILNIESGKNIFYRCEYDRDNGYDVRAVFADGTNQTQELSVTGWDDVPLDGKKVEWFEVIDRDGIIVDAAKIPDYGASGLIMERRAADTDTWYQEL